MKLAIVTELFSPSIGGQEVRYLEMGRALVQSGHQVDVFTIRSAADLPKHENIDGISVFRVVDGFKYQSSFWGSRNVTDIVKLSAKILASRRSLRNYDVILFNKWPILPQILFRLVPARSKGVVDWCEIRSGPWWDSLYRLFATTCYRHVVVAKHIGLDLARRYRLDQRRIKVIVSGISAAAYQSCAEDKIDRMLLFFGRLSEHKNPLLLLESFVAGNLAAEGFTLHIAGGGPQLAQVQARFGSAPGVHVHGAVSDQTKLQLLRQAALLVLPSRREGFPRVIAEAAAAGTPSLTTHYPDNGAVAVVREYSIGWVCRPGLDDLAQALRQRGAICEDWHNTSRRCRTVANGEFDWRSVCNEFLTFARDSSK
jgi:glycosyltransferase involved in cell wall biosynthesis